ncbi:MAG: flagellar protein FliT [Lachnobacterium sp.]|nr:flagellar protein FliT [Lachnobacterium sp.]
MPNESYIAILEESLVKKSDILAHLLLLCQEQSDILDDADMTPEMFDENVQKKEVLITRLANLDDGFEQLYQRVREELASNKNQYRDSIRHMQELIREVTDKSVQIQAIEARNKEKVQTRFGEIRSQIREVKHSGRAVSNYYQNMMKMNAVEPQFWDSKK